MKIDMATIGAVKFEAKNYGLLIKVHNNVLRDASPEQSAATKAVIAAMVERTIQEQNGEAGSNAAQP